MACVKSVLYNDGEGNRFAIVVSDNGGGSRDLIVFDPKTGASSLMKDVPRREPSGVEGEDLGVTWHSA